MNILIQSILFSTFIWSIIFEKFLFLIITSILLIYTFLHLKTQKNFQNKLQFYNSNFHDSGYPPLKLKFEINLSKIESFLTSYNKKNPLKRLTKTHIALKSLGEGLKKLKNGYLTFGNFKNNKETNISLVINVDKTNITMLKVHNCQKNTIKQIANQIKGKISKIKTHQNTDLKDQDKIFKFIPSYILEFSVWLVGFISYDLQKEWSLFKVKKNHFGNNLVTNVAGFGCKDAVAPIVPCAKSAVLLVLNGERESVVFEDGQFLKRRVAWVNLIFDSRFLYGDAVLRSVEVIRKVWDRFEEYL